MKRKPSNSLERMLQRFGEFAASGPIVPWLPKNANLAEVRRTAERIRTGAMRIRNSPLDPETGAWLLNRAVEQQEVINETKADMDTDPLLARCGSDKERQRQLRRRAEFHRLKIAAREPDSGAAEKFRQKSRARRRELGRPGRRRGDEREPVRRRQIVLPLTFVVGNAQHVFLDPFGTNLQEALEAWFPDQFRRSEDGDPWCSAPVEWCGWGDLQKRVVAALGEDGAPHLMNTSANKGVFLPGEVEPSGLSEIEGDLSAHVAIGSVGGLIEELERFAARTALPVDDATLQELPAKVGDYEFALLTYAQVLRAAHYARKTRIPLWAVKHTWPIE